MKKKHLIIVFLFLVTTFARSENILEYTGIKCGNLFNTFYVNSSSKNIEKPIDIYSNLKLIVPSLGDLSKATEMSSLQKSEMEENKKELIKLGATDDILKITRVERFEISGQVVDVFAYPDGEVHYITNFFKDKNLKERPLVRVRNCRVED